MGLAGVAGSGVSSANVGILQSWVPTASTQAVDSGGVPIAYDVCDETANPTCDPLGAVVSIPVGVFAASTPQFQKHHRYIISSDFQTGGHKVSGRFHFNRQRSIVAGALPVEQFNSTNALDSRRLTLTDVWSVTPNVVNELRFGWMRRTGPNLDVRDTPAPAGTDVFGNYTIDEMSLGIGPQSNFPQGQAGNTYQLANNLTWVKGRHILKLGFDVRNIIRGGGFLPRARGDYAWTADTGAALGVLPVLSGLDGFVRDVFPNRVSIRGVGSGFFAQNRTAFYAFVQDSWRIHPRVTLDFGFRYEYTETARDSARQVENGLSNIGSITGEVYTPELLLATSQGGAGCVDLAGCELDPLNGTPIFDNLSTAHQQVLLSHIGTSLIFKAPEADLDNIAPRLGLSWDLFGDGSTSLRAGVGRGFDVLFGNLPLLQLPPQAQAENREGNACFLSPSPGWCINTDGGEPLNPSGLSDIRHNTSGFLASGGLLPVLPLDTTFDPIIARAATGAFVLDDDPLPETWTWTLSLQRELFGDFMVEARYVGTHAIHLFVQRHPNTGIPVYFNQPSLRLPVFTSTSQVPGSFAAGDPTLAAFDLARATGTSSSRMLSPYGFRGAMTEFSPIANSSYHGASAILRKRLSTEEWGGLMFNFNWTWSKTIDNIENDLFTSLLNPRRPFNHTDVSIQRGLSGMHRAHKVGLTWFYELPRWEGDSGAMNKLMNGWQFSGTYLYETGQPVTVIAFRDIDGNADFSALDFVYRNISGTAGVGTDSRAV
jgi:hypothetical protein